MIYGEDIYLIPLERDSLECVRSWINDPEINEWMATGHVPISREAEERFFDNLESSEANQIYEIHLKEDDRHIGIIGLHFIEMVHRAAELGVTIGEKDTQDRGYGTDSILTILRFAFHTLGLNSVRISYIEGNDTGAHLYTKLGFRESGRQRERMYLRGSFRDLIMLDMTRAEYDAMHP